MKFCKIPEMRIGTLVDFCEDLTRAGSKDLENYIAVCRADMHGCKRTIAKEEDLIFEQNATRLRQIVAILQDIKATDMPNFAVLPKDEHFGNLYREFRIQKVRQIMHSAQNS